MNPLIIFCTCGSEDEANRLAERLVDARLAACVNILPGVRSVYRWQGTIEKAEEWLLLIKSSEGHFAGLEAFIRENHSYDVPEIVAVPITTGSQAYLAWLELGMN